jgi:endonuclease III
MGVGPKVADCILLFSYNKFEAFPVDTWVKKILKDYYAFEPKTNDFLDQESYMKESLLTKLDKPGQKIVYISTNHPQPRSSGCKDINGFT